MNAVASNKQFTLPPLKAVSTLLLMVPIINKLGVSCRPTNFEAIVLKLMTFRLAMANLDHILMSWW